MEQPDDITLEEKPSLGKSLSRARTTRELSQQDIANELNLSKVIINALENDEVIEGVSPTYVRGYQRAYIRFLELDEAELLGENLAASQFSSTHENLQTIDNDMFMRGNRSSIGFPFRLLMPLLLVGLAVVYWPQIFSFFSPGSDEQTTQAAIVQTETDTQMIQTVEIKATSDNTAAVVTEPEIEQIQQTQRVLLTENELENEPFDEGGHLTVEKVVDLTESIIDESEITQSDQDDVDENLQSEQAGLASTDSPETHSEITIIATGESWLDIKDAENTRLFRNILKLDQITVTGVLPLKIRTGNLQALRVQANRGEQRKVDVFDDSTTVANFLVEKDESGRLKFTAQ